MDPIRPISPTSAGRTPVPVERLERVSRERDRPANERPPARRRPPREPERDGEDEGGEGRHIDIRV